MRRVAIQRAPQELTNVGRHGFGDRRLLHDHRRQNLPHGFPGIERAARQHFREDYAEGPDVGAPVDGLALGLFRAHVPGRPHDHARQRPPHRQGGRGCRIGRRRVRRERLGQAEVENFHATLGCDLDISGLQVAMDDAFIVRVLQSLGNLPRDGQSLIQRNGSV